MVSGRGRSHCLELGGGLTRATRVGSFLQKGSHSNQGAYDDKRAQAEASKDTVEAGGTNPGGVDHVETKTQRHCQRRRGEANVFVDDIFVS